MAYFPFYMDITGKKGVIVGGGRIALHKIGRLLPFSPQLTVIAPDILPEIENMDVSEPDMPDGIPQLVICEQRLFQEEDLQDAFFVIAATDDEQLNEQVSRLCRRKGIPVNVVDDKEKCTFIFPSIVKRGALTVAVSTEGASPHIAATLRRQVEKTLPAQTEEILDYLAWLRPIAKSRISDPKKRSAFLKEAAQFCFDEDMVLTEEETYRRLEEMEG